MNKKSFYLKIILLLLVLIVSVYEVIVLSLNLYDDLINHVDFTINMVGVILFSVIIGFDLFFIFFLWYKRKMRKRYYTLKK